MAGSPRSGAKVSAHACTNRRRPRRCGRRWSPVVITRRKAPKVRPVPRAKNRATTVNGVNGDDGEDGENGHHGGNCPVGGGLETDAEGVPGSAPLSSMVALTFCDAADTGTDNIADYVKALVGHYGTRTMPDGIEFPLAAAATDSVRAIAGLSADIVVKWLDPLGWQHQRPATTPRFAPTPTLSPTRRRLGARRDAAMERQRNLRLDLGEPRIHLQRPTPTTAPTGQHMTLASSSPTGAPDESPSTSAWSDADLTSTSTTTRSRSAARGFSSSRIRRRASGRSIEAQSHCATTRRATRVPVTGHGWPPIRRHRRRSRGVVVGILSDCSGGQTPWGTIITAEENVQDFYGDLEACWTGQPLRPRPGLRSRRQRQLNGASPSRLHQPRRKPRTPDPYGYLVEIDPGAARRVLRHRHARVGHRKLGALGRAHWENAAFAVDADWKLLPGQPIVLYAGDDRRCGRIYKFVSASATRSA